MRQLPEALQPLAAYNQFCLYLLRPNPKNPNKTDKFPCDLSGDIKDAHDPTIWLDAETALSAAELFGPPYGAGFVLSENDPFYFFDVDDCLAEGPAWSPIATELMGRFPGAAVEVSQSGRGLHIIGTGSPTLPPQQRRKKSNGGPTEVFDLYTEKRFIALTGLNIIGSVSTPADQVQLDYVVGKWLEKQGGGVDGWTSEPVPEWTGPGDNDELIERALKTRGAGATFGNTATFEQLWNNDQDRLAECYPDDHGHGGADLSRVDQALAQHLAFWTGNNCERILELMWLSGLVRDKWTDREGDYLERTILNAVSMQTSVYSISPGEDKIAEEFGGVKLRATSDAQREYANRVRAEKLLKCAGDVALIEQFCAVPTAKFWLNNKDRTVEEIHKVLTPIEAAPSPGANFITEPEVLSGYQYLGATQQIDYFKGCVYVQDLHRVFTPTGALLKPEQFNATYGGYSFQLDDGGDKVTRKAWEAFTESQIVRYPKADSMCFRPSLPAAALVQEEGRALVNTYIPLEIWTKPGDISRFLQHMEKILPVKRDREIILAYMAACVQHQGVKFQWAPLIQGAEGNGKTLLTRCVRYAVGKRYTHYPKAAQLASNFNGWMVGKVFYGVEDIYVEEHKKDVIEALKPMITGEELEVERKGVDQITADVCGNFMFNSNHKDAVKKTRDDRRFAVFYSAQQSVAEIMRDGMGGLYFPSLYGWLESGGYAMVAHYLAEYAIPEEFNPAGNCRRAPETSSTMEAVSASMGRIEQEIEEAIEEARPGFCGGWVSSVAVERLLQLTHSTRMVPPNKRREMMQTLGYDWHPALNNGRVNNPIPLDEGKKPRLFIREGHIATNIEAPAEVARVYQEAQGGAVAPAGRAAEVFNAK